MSWGPGAQIDRYLVEGRLGAGGMGVVWRARDLETGVPYAIKTLPTQADADLLERFRREGLAQARADGHPNVVRIHSSGTAHGHHYLVMALAEGGDLSERLRTGPLAPERVREIGIQLAEGLEWLHQAGVLHRDLKPANVLFDEEGRPLLVDFGLARVAEADSLTQTGALLGTPSYMSPEQARGERAQLGPRSDVFGLGALLYHCLTGRPPFLGSTTLSTLLEVTEQDPPSIRRLRPEVPLDLVATCERALQKDPGRRFPSAAALAEALARAESTKAHAPWGSAALAGAALLGLLALAGAALWPQAPVPATPSPKPTERAATSPATPASARSREPAWFVSLPSALKPPRLPRTSRPARAPANTSTAAKARSWSGSRRARS